MHVVNKVNSWSGRLVVALNSPAHYTFPAFSTSWWQGQSLTLLGTGFSINLPKWLVHRAKISNHFVSEHDGSVSCSRIKWLLKGYSRTVLPYRAMQWRSNSGLHGALCKLNGGDTHKRRGAASVTYPLQVFPDWSDWHPHNLPFPHFPSNYSEARAMRHWC
jgi:hypothetical protein